MNDQNMLSALISNRSFTMTNPRQTFKRWERRIFLNGTVWKFHRSSCRVFVPALCSCRKVVIYLVTKWNLKSNECSNEKQNTCSSINWEGWKGDGREIIVKDKKKIYVFARLVLMGNYRLSQVTFLVRWKKSSTVICLGILGIPHESRLRWGGLDNS